MVNIICLIIAAICAIAGYFVQKKNYSWNKFWILSLLVILSAGFFCAGITSSESCDYTYYGGSKLQGACNISKPFRTIIEIIVDF